MNADLITEAAFAIFKEFVRERDPYRARQRFDRLKPLARERYESEAKACFHVFEMFQIGAAS